ncbi:major facilitator superfamily domain-containing protein [Boeremia exigua]|uniref:major facilitator superfamily domain-containing protein n=1 Tax=Boeremia exigua TaxID=749465 RepID=UPI001E8E4B67|nr:major facilitator superfamily domain-containing protein [Boeremia exigua]KAH6644749.1 major facilitator superfamily domain-containing protein [Boeremia exigua]
MHPTDDKPMDEKTENAEQRLDALDPAEVKTLLWRLDIHILPILALLFLCSFIDRTNVGNAKILGLEKDLGMDDSQYAIGLCVFYATYIASELPSNLVLKKVSPRVWLPALTAVWGILTMCLGFVTGFSSFVAVRALLGIAEGGLLPGMVLYLSHFYKRTELALRIGIFYTAASLSGAFGGLLARGLNAIGPAGGLEGWRWIFIIEGILTFLVGVSSAIFLPNSIESAGFLSVSEKQCSRIRLNTSAVHESFSWAEVRRGVFNLQVWLSATAYFCILCGLYSFGLFLPTIVKGGFSTDPNQAQLWTVIPYAVAAAFTVVAAFVSDRIALRGPVMLVTLPIAIIGYAVISVTTNPKVQYGMTFMMATGMYASVPCILSWNSNNSAGHYKRATTTALQLAIANSGGFVASFVYPKSEGPNFHKSHQIMLGLLCAAWVLIAANVAWVAKLNRDKVLGKYAQFEGYTDDDRAPSFKMVL